jgi:RNA polymerase sigma-B factor
MRLRATIRTSDHATVIRVELSGELDVETSALVSGCVATACRVSARSVVLDLGAVTVLGRSGVDALLEAREAVERAGSQFMLGNVPASLADALPPGLSGCGTPAAPAAEALPERVPGGSRHLRSVPDVPPGAAEDLVRAHGKLAERLATRFAGRGQATEDLRQVAYLGLVMAAQRFDPDRGVRFAAFAQATIVGELKKYFRDHAWQVRVARPVQELYLAVRAASEDMTHDLGRTPTPTELAAHLGVTEEQVVESLEVRSALHVDSLDRPRDDDGRASWYEAPTEEDGYRLVEERSWLVPALRLLPERERRIVKLRFFDDLPQSAIAAKVGISQMHVSRLLARSLETLRAAAGEAAEAG